MFFLLWFFVCCPSPPPIIAKQVVKLLEEIHGELLLHGLPLDHPGLGPGDGEYQSQKGMAKDPHYQARQRNPLGHVV